MIEPQIYTRLSTDSTVTAVCPRIYPTAPPDNAVLPLIVYTVQSASSEPVGTNPQPSLARYELTVDVYGVSLDQVRDTALVVRTSLHGYNSGTSLLGVFYSSYNTEFIDPGYKSSTAFTVWGTPG